MSKPITNVHIHVFDARCAPERFFLVLPLWIVRKFARPLKSFLMSKVGLALIRQWAVFASTIHDKGKIARYIAFTKIGSEANQDEIFKIALSAGQVYDKKVRLIGLTLNMDHMDSEKSSPSNFKNYVTQLEEIKNIKRYNPEQFFPFLSVDPRQFTPGKLSTWVKDQMTKGFDHKGQLYRYFYGLKIYPALGFFPFDPALEKVYAFAEQHGIPVMTHCTRGGSQYIGNNIQGLIAHKPAMMLPTVVSPDLKKHIEEIHQRIADYYAQGWIKNDNMGNNDRACDLFTHPQNYIPVLEKFPKLKICIAHMGGEGEFYETTELAKKGEKDNTKIPGFEDLLEIRTKDGKRWLEWIQEMMQQYPSLYTDISYTVSYFDHKAKRIVDRLANFAEVVDNSGQQLGQRILFGTDFFMTEQEKKEGDLYGLMMRSDGLKKWVDGFCRDNVEGFVGW